MGCDGVGLYAAYAPGAGWPGLRFVHARNTALWSTMRGVGARVDVEMGAGDETGRVALGCQLLQTIFTFESSTLSLLSLLPLTEHIPNENLLLINPGKERLTFSSDASKLAERLKCSAVCRVELAH